MVLLVFLIQHNDYVPGKKQGLGKASLSKLLLTESALTAQGSAFEHTRVKDYLQKSIQIFALFPKLLIISPMG